MKSTCSPSDERQEERGQRGREESEAAELVGREEGETDGDAEGENEEQVHDEEGQEAGDASEIVSTRTRLRLIQIFWISEPDTEPN